MDHLKKAYDSVNHGHGWLEEMMILRRFPVGLSRTVVKLSKSWNKKGSGNYKARTRYIRFLKGLPQGDALCPRLFTVCLSPIAWKISVYEGYNYLSPSA